MATKRTKKTEAAPSPEVKPVEKTAARRRAPRAKKAAPVVSIPTDPISLAALRDEITALAHRYWMENGCRHGHAHEDWSRAESTVKSKYGI